jgi:hypothetical protein
MKGSARQVPRPSAPKQVISLRDLTPPRGWYNVYIGIYSMTGQDGGLPGCTSSSHVCHILQMTQVVAWPDSTIKRNLATK